MKMREIVRDCDYSVSKLYKICFYFSTVEYFVISCGAETINQLVSQCSVSQSVLNAAMYHLVN